MKVKRILSGILLAILIITSIVMFNIQYALGENEDDWRNCGWTYREQVNIVENSGYSLVNFPIEVSFRHNGNIQPDGKDIRIVDGGFEIPYCIIELNSTHVTLMFQVNVTALSTKKVYIYYGNPNASTPNYPLVPLTIVEGNTGYAIIDNLVYIGWDYTSWGWSNSVILWKDFKIDFNRNNDPRDDMDLISDYGDRRGGIGRYRDDIRAIGLGDYKGYVRTPVYVDINFADATLRIYRNNPWVETTQADFLHIFSPSWDYANYGLGSEQNIIDGKDIIMTPPSDRLWNLIYVSPVNPRWMAFRDSRTGAIFGSIGLNVGATYNFCLAAKESSAWDRCIRYDATSYPIFEPHDQPSNCRIYWYGDNSNNYSGIEKLAQILFNQPSIFVGNEEICKPYVIIDEVFVSDQRVDVGSTQTIGFHLKLSNGSNVVGCEVYINGSKYITNDDGWIRFSVKYDSIGKRTWTVTGVNYQNITVFKKVVDDPYIIWDRVVVTLKVPNIRLEVNSSANIQKTALYEYDRAPFIGSIYLNDTEVKETVGRYGYKALSISDSKYNLTVFRSNEVYCIFDRIKIKYEVEALIPYNIQVTVDLRFEYDNSPVEDAFVRVNDIVAEHIGGGTYRTFFNTLAPYLKINIRVKRVGFNLIEVERVIYLLGNIFLEFSFIALGIFAILGFNIRRVRKKKWLTKLVELVKDTGQIEIEKASEIIGVDVARIKDLLLNLIDEGKIKGTFTLDGKSFITEEKLMEKIMEELKSKE